MALEEGEGHQGCREEVGEGEELLEDQEEEEEEEEHLEEEVEEAGLLVDPEGEEGVLHMKRVGP